MVILTVFVGNVNLILLPTRELGVRNDEPVRIHAEEGIDIPA